MDEPQHCDRHPERETLISCSSCGRPVCTDCMRTAAVGIKCPDCAGTRATGAGGAPARRLNLLPMANGAPLTVALIAICVLVGIVALTQGLGINGGGNSQIVVDLGLFGPFVADGQWYRIITAAFVHAGLVHLFFNMIVLWWLGGALERYAGSLRMGLVLLASVVWGSAGALLMAPEALTVGMSGGIYGLMAALLVLERQQGMALLGSGLGVFLLLNLGLTFIIPGISIGGHLGGILGGFLAAMAMSALGKGHLAYGKWTPATMGGMALVIVAGFGVAVLLA